ncbi:MAG: hypothetical protein OHK0023_05290 [Anaerolineae bacterium]
MEVLGKLNAKRILLVEHDIQTATQLGALLRRAGYEVENAYNSGDALAASHDRFAVALVNSSMKDRNGKNILQVIRDHASFAKLPVLLLDEPGADVTSANANPSAAQARLLARIAAQLAKERQSNITQVISGRANGPSRRTTGTLTAVRDTQAMPPSLEDDPSHRSRAVIDAQYRQLAALRTLSELGRSIASVLDLDEVLNKIAEAAATLTSAEESLLLLPDEQDEALYLRAMKGVDESNAKNFRIRSTEPLVGRVYRTGEPIIVADEQGLTRVKTEYLIRAAIYVPMQFKGKLIGVLGVHNRRVPRQFNVHDQELLTDLAAYAAVAIENARLYEDRMVQNRQLETLVEVGMSVNSTLTLSNVLMTISRQIIKAIDVSACLIEQRASVTQERETKTGDTAVLPENELFTLAQTWQAAWSVTNAPLISLDARPMLKQSLQQNIAYIAGREQGSAKLNAELNILREVGAERLTVLPLRVGNNVPFGLIELYYRATVPSEPPSSEMRARIRSHAAEIYALLRLKPEVRPAPQVFEHAHAILNQSGADWLVMHVLNERNDHLLRILQYGAGVFLDPPRPEMPLIPIELQPVLDKDSHPVYVTATQADLPETLREMLVGYGAESALFLPMQIKGKVAGMFTIYDTNATRVFSQDEMNLAMAMVSQAATAIENARLYRDLERSLTNLKQTQASLVQAARLSTIGELAAVVAHQINNPLTTIIVDSEIMLHDMKPGDPNHEAITAIHRAGQRAHTVVKRLLSAARRNGDDKPQWIEVHQTIRNTLELVSTHIERGQVRFEVELDVSVPSYVLAMPNQLEDAWLNLLMNARDAIQDMPSPAMGILSRRAKDQLDVMVWDNGSGIPPNYRDRIFEPFFTTKPPGHGTGLGLYICKQIIVQAGGKISVDSAPNQGTLFRVRLPVSETREQ